MHRSRLSKLLSGQLETHVAQPVGRKVVFRYRSQTFWPERGLVCVVDERSGEFKQCSCRDWAYRTKQFQADLFRNKYADERNEQQRMLEDMVRCYWLAKRQGDPFNPRSMREVSHDKRSIRILVPEQITAQAPAAPLYTGT